MTDLMAKMRVSFFTDDAGKLGMPVGFLRALASASYSYEYGDTTEDLAWRNTLSFRETDLRYVRNLSPATSPGEAELTIEKIYHEGTHAWLDVYSDEPKVASLAAKSRQYYKNAPLKGGKLANDTYRIFHEAMAMYVGHRMSQWWQALATLTSLRDTLPNVVPTLLSSRLKQCKQARRDYEAAMRLRVFGYQEASYFDSTQLDCKRVISSEMRNFADRAFLENKVPDQFVRSGAPKKVWDELAKLYPRQLGS